MNKTSMSCGSRISRAWEFLYSLKLRVFCGSRISRAWEFSYIQKLIFLKNYCMYEKSWNWKNSDSKRSKKINSCTTCTTIRFFLMDKKNYFLKFSLENKIMNEGEKMRGEII